MAEVVTTVWTPRGAWAGIAFPGRHGRGAGAAGIKIDILDRALAILVLGNGDRDTLNAAIRVRFALDLPETGRVAFGLVGDLVWSAPGQWLVVGARRGVLDDLPEALADVASVTDQSDARGLLRVSGLCVREALAKGFSIDLHPSVFPPGAVAVTKVAHLSVQIWREGDGYGIAVPRSFAGSFWIWLMDAAAAFGCEVRD